MRRKPMLGSLAGAALLLFGALAPPASAQTGGAYRLTWARLPASGGVSAGEGYSLGATGGLPEPGPTQRGGAYTLNGGVVNAGSAGRPLPPDQWLYLPQITR
jgi:hypothetical protein